MRDQDVLIERLRGEAEELDEVDRVALEPLFAALAAEREAARAEFPATLDSDRYLALLARLEAEPPLARGRRAARSTSIWRREYRRTRKAITALGDAPPDAELHAARIRVKRARYAAELAGPELGRKGAAFVEAAKELQDVLGAHQDAVVGEQVLRRLAPGLPGSALAMGRLVDREQARRAEARATWHDAWRALSTGARRRSAHDALVVVRHGSAGDRAMGGRRPAAAARQEGPQAGGAAAGRPRGAQIRRIVSSPYLRCIQTVEPLATARGLEIEQVAELGEERQTPTGPPFLAALLGDDTVACVHGGIECALGIDLRFRKGAVWLFRGRARPPARS